MFSGHNLIITYDSHMLTWHMVHTKYNYILHCIFLLNISWTFSQINTYLGVLRIKLQVLTLAYKPQSDPKPPGLSLAPLLHCPPYSLSPRRAGLAGLWGSSACTCSGPLHLQCLSAEPLLPDAHKPHSHASLTSHLLTPFVK